MSMRLNTEIGKAMRSDSDRGEARRAFAEKRTPQYESNGA
jgi:hypothetical protein